jgi:hypothetical protein
LPAASSNISDWSLTLASCATLTVTSATLKPTELIPATLKVVAKAATFELSWTFGRSDESKLKASTEKKAVDKFLNVSSFEYFFNLFPPNTK